MSGDAGEDSAWVLRQAFRPQHGSCWIADLPAELHELTDSNQAPYQSGLGLLENGNPLGPAHAVHAMIAETGRGAYSFWTSVLYFSTSDGSDPNTNGRSYTVVIPTSSSAPDKGFDRPAVEPSAWIAPTPSLRCAIYGLGNRGLGLGRLMADFAGVEIAWIVDVSQSRVDRALGLFGADVRGTVDMLAPLADSSVDIVFVMAPDHLHRVIAEPAFQAGKHVFVEKPLATTGADARAILKAWRESGRILQLGYVLRQAPFYATIRDVLRQGMLGPVRIASLSEQLDVRHGASFMRRWHSQSTFSGGLLVHKACHDLDIICWLFDSQARLVSSFGGLDIFAGPPPAPFCSQCDRRESCAYVDTALHERRTPQEAADPTAYGLDRCVFRTDKDIVDNQVVSFVLANGVRGTFYLAMQGPNRSERGITLIGDDGRLDGVFEDASFTVTFTDPRRPPFVWSAPARSQGGHGGGDRVTLFDFFSACAGRAPAPVSSSEDALRGLTFALAVERARKAGEVVQLDDAAFRPGDAT